MDYAKNAGESEAMSKTADEGQEDAEDAFEKYGKYGVAPVGIANSTGSVKIVHSDEATLQDIYYQYLAGGEKAQNDRGVTLMLRDFPYRLQVEPDILQLLRQTCKMEHVDYIYLPMNVEACTPKMRGTRNKGYCFIHFSVAATAQAFASRMHDHVAYDVSGEKAITVSMAKFQGLHTNLMNLLDTSSKKWRPKEGFAYIRGSKGDLVCVGLLPLRNLLKVGPKRIAARHGKAPGRKTAVPQPVFSEVLPLSSAA
jgi:hypothetical protein